MCDHHRLRTQPSLGEVEHVNFLSENIGGLFMQEDYSDITLLVEGTRFPAHKVILAARSEYFRALLFGGLRESRSDCGEIEMKDTSAAAFKHLLKYIYTSKMNLSDLKEEALLDVLGLSHQYGFTHLEGAISTYLRAILNIRNVCLIYDIGSLYNLDMLSQTCCEFMDRNAAEILNSDAFLSLSASALEAVLCRDSFCAPEVDIFNSVKRWTEQNSENKMEAVMGVVRLPLMNLEDLLNIVRTSNLVSADLILDAIKLKNESRDMDLHYRGFLTLEENVATLRHGAQVLRGEMKAALLDGDTQNYDLDRGFTRHPIDDNQGQGIVIKLGQPSIINTIRLLLWDKDMRSYSYYIEVSMDERDWIRVVDHTKFLCRSWQHLYFPARVARYARVVGSHNTVNRVFHLVAFECSYSKTTYDLDGGIIVPVDNVATIEASACVIEGVSRSRNALINGDTKNYDWDSGYTCHQLGSGAIIVQLAQPYVIDSIRLLLWDCDGRSYSYYVEVSVDQLNWQLVADKTREGCRSWQIITFEKRPITFIKIVGTHNTANEVFHCVHFECPADASSLSDQGDHGNMYQASQNNRIRTSSSGTSSCTVTAPIPAPPVFSNASIPTQPVVAMARVNPMPANAIDLGLGVAGGPAMAAGPSRPLIQSGAPQMAHSVPNRPDILETESDDSLDGGLNMAGAGVMGAVGGHGAIGDASSGVVMEKENLQGVRIVWVDRGDGLGVENACLPDEARSSPGRSHGNSPLRRDHSPNSHPGNRLPNPSDPRNNSPNNLNTSRSPGSSLPRPDVSLSGGNLFHRVTAQEGGHSTRLVQAHEGGHSSRQGALQGLDMDVRPRTLSSRFEGSHEGSRNRGHEGGHFVADEDIVLFHEPHQAEGGRQQAEGGRQQAEGGRSEEETLVFGEHSPTDPDNFSFGDGNR